MGVLLTLQGHLDGAFVLHLDTLFHLIRVMTQEITISNEKGGESWLYMENLLTR